MKHYLSIAEEWKELKENILREHLRIRPTLLKIIQEFEEVSSQKILAEHIDTICEVKFYPFWGGFAYTYTPGWVAEPDPQQNWEWTLSDTKKVLSFLRSLKGEEEVKILFREWCEKIY